MDVKNSNGTLLSEGDSVALIKNLKVKGSSLTLKRGTERHAEQSEASRVLTKDYQSY